MYRAQPQPNDYANDFVPGRWIQANIIIITIGNSVIEENSNRLLCMNKKRARSTLTTSCAISLNYRVSDLFLQGSFSVILLIGFYFYFYFFKQTANINRRCIASQYFDENDLEFEKIWHRID